MPDSRHNNQLNLHDICQLRNVSDKLEKKNVSPFCLVFPNLSRNSFLQSYVTYYCRYERYWMLLGYLRV